jgi:hypothetical protein
VGEFRKMQIRGSQMRRRQTFQPSTAHRKPVKPKPTIDPMNADPVENPTAVDFSAAGTHLEKCMWGEQISRHKQLHSGMLLF